MGTETKRYPGPKPFSAQEAIVFRGRDKDVERLLQTLIRYDQVLVYAKSGVGKSSLIRAGLVPILAEHAWTIINVRFYPCRNEADKRPVQRVLEALKGVFTGPSNSYLSKFLGNEDNLWKRFKSAQTDSDPQYLFVFDQFEELFTYPAKDILNFKRQLADLMYDAVPSRHLVELRKAEAETPGLLTASEKRMLYKKPSVKVLGAIRDDSLHHVLHLADYLPDLQQNLFELKPLDRTQALAAIVEPAENEHGQFLSPPFEITTEALESVLDFLTKGNSKPADSTLLQIICQDLEKKAGRKEIGKSDLPNFADLVKEFYLDIVNAVPDTSPLKVRKFVEGRLIHGGRRVPMPENECEHELGATALKFLVDEHLLRAEQNSVGGLSYELGHDTLVDPIRELRDVRQAEEAEEERLAGERLLRDELAKQRAVREKEHRRLLRTRISLGIAVAATMVSMWLYVYAQGKKREAMESEKVAKAKSVELEIAKRDVETALGIAREQIEKFEAADRARIKVMVDQYVAKAESFKRNNEMRFAIETLEEALKLDSTRADIRQKIEDWKR